MTIKKTTQSNGLRILSQELPHAHSVSLGIWVGAGARHETDSQHGLAHLLEHMAFKGTKTRSALDIVQQIEAVGGDVNAATSLERTAYYARVLKEDLQLGVDILSDIVLNPIFQEEELSREKGVIHSEIGQHLDTPDDVAFDIMRDLAFPSHSMGRNILGTPNTVQSFSKDDLAEFRGQHYSSSNMLIAAVGNVNHEELIDSIAEFTLIPPKISCDNTPPVFVGGEKHLERDIEQAHMVLGFESLSQKDPNYYSAQLLSSILGGGMSSRLFQKVREERGLAYSVFSYSWSFSDTGIFGIYAGTNPEDIKEASHVIADELMSLAKNITPEELDTARAQMKAGLLMGLESSYVRAERMARQFMIFGREIPINETMASIDAVSAENLQELAANMFSSDHLSAAVVGPAGHGLENESIKSLF